MGIAERKAREKEERKALIRKKAKELIWESGLPAVSVQSIADAAELSKAAIYLYFDTKEKIFIDILNSSADEFVTYVKKKMDPDDSGIDALKKLWQGYLGFFGESNDVMIMTGIKNYIDPHFLPYIDTDTTEPQSAKKMIGLIADVLERGVKDCTLDQSIVPVDTARLIFLIVTAIIDNVARLPREQRDLNFIRKELRRTCELLLRGLAADGIQKNFLTL